MAVAEVVGEQRWKEYFAAVFRVDGVEEVRNIPRGKLLKMTEEFANRLLVGEVHAFYVAEEVVKPEVKEATRLD